MTIPETTKTAVMASGERKRKSQTEAQRNDDKHRCIHECVQRRKLVPG